MSERCPSSPAMKSWTQPQGMYATRAALSESSRSGGLSRSMGGREGPLLASSEMVSIQRRSLFVKGPLGGCCRLSTILCRRRAASVVRAKYAAWDPSSNSADRSATPFSGIELRGFLRPCRRGFFATGAMESTLLCMPPRTTFVSIAVFFTRATGVHATSSSLCKGR